MDALKIVDRDGDTLTTQQLCDGSAAYVVARTGDHAVAVDLDRDGVIALHGWLAAHLMLTEPAVVEEFQESSTIAGEAQSLAYGDRNDGYGHPRRNFTRIAHMWTALLSDKLAEGEFIDTDDVGRLMVALKLSRDVNAAKRDNRVDAIGYLIAMDRCETGR